MKPVKVGLLGLGTVGTGVVRIVEGNQEDLSRQVGSPIIIEKIAVKNIENIVPLKWRRPSLLRTHGKLFGTLKLM